MSEEKRVGSGVRTHKDLEVWKRAMALARGIYELTKGFPKEEVYGLVAQMRRAAVSVPSNIAEGAARNSNKEIIQYLYVSLGSLAELDTQVVLARDLGYKHDEDIAGGIEEVRRLVLGLIKYIKSKE